MVQRRGLAPTLQAITLNVAWKLIEKYLKVSGAAPKAIKPIPQCVPHVLALAQLPPTNRDQLMARYAYLGTATGLIEQLRVRQLVFEANMRIERRNSTPPDNRPGVLFPSLHSPYCNRRYFQRSEAQAANLLSKLATDD